MLKKHHKILNAIFLLLLFFPLATKAQNSKVVSIPLIEYIQTLEASFNVKFSYVDEDIQDLSITPILSDDLSVILTGIQNHTQLQVKKLSDRYYTLYKSTTVDICAQVLDNYEANTIPGATIEVLGSSIALVTNFEGSFALENIPRQAIIRIRYLGYKTRYIRAEELVNPSPCQQVLLVPNYEELDEVILFKLMTTGLSQQRDGSILLTIDDFGILPGLIEPDVLQTVQALPGIKSIDETVSDINVRGGTNDQNLILWDGIKMYQSGHFFGLISAFNPYLTDKVTIIKNGTSAQYGDGVSSIINMESQNNIHDSFFGGAGFNLISGDVYAHVPLSTKLAFQFSARRSVTDFFNTPTYNRFFDKAFQDSKIKDNNSQATDAEIIREEDFYFYDISGKLLYDLNDDQKVRLSFINIKNDLAYTETAKDSSQSSQSGLDQNNFSFGGNLESTWTSNFSTNLNMYYTRYNLDARNSTDNGNQQLFQNNQVLETAVKLNTQYEFSNTLSLLNGYAFTEVGIINFTNVTQPAFKSNIKGVLRQHSVFSELNYTSLDKKLNGRIGARLNYLENLETFKEWILEPRLSLAYKFTKHFNGELLGEFKNQSTNQIIDLEQNFLGIEKHRWILSDNDELPITKSKQGSIGFNYDNKSWYLGLQGFYKEVNGISTSTQGFQNQNQFNGEIGKYDVKGIEFLINKKTNTFSTWLSYAYNLNNYTFEDITPKTFPNNLDIRHTITFAGTYSYEGLKLGLGLNYRTGKPYTEPQEGDNAVDRTSFPNTINYQENNSSRLPHYLRADASVIYDFEMGNRVKASVGASILNLLNKRNVLNTYYRLNDDNQIQTIESVSLGITPNVSFRLSF
ncbi:TonB-dependent receptor [Flavobacteriaceae bacterium KMM 6897]|nr:TonB-dependent receptor [Flavobacteriaceae bacterium KMM 6897]MEB8344923.1 TonB-dependent receptor [Flavobacteriaceae bacterium KMM 6898]